MENLRPHAELIVLENGIEPDHNIDIDEDNFEMEEDNSDFDDDSGSLIVLLPDEDGEPPSRIAEVPYVFGEITVEDGDMDADFLTDIEIEDFLSNIRPVKAVKRKIQTKGRQTRRKWRSRDRFKNRSNSRIRSRSPRKRTSLPPSNIMRPER